MRVRVTSQSDVATVGKIPRRCAPAPSPFDKGSTAFGAGRDFSKGGLLARMGQRPSRGMPRLDPRPQLRKRGETPRLRTRAVPARSLAARCRRYVAAISNRGNNTVAEASDPPGEFRGWTRGHNWRNAAGRRVYGTRAVPVRLLAARCRRYVAAISDRGYNTVAEASDPPAEAESRRGGRSHIQRIGRRVCAGSVLQCSAVVATLRGVLCGYGRRRRATLLQRSCNDDNVAERRCYSAAATAMTSQSDVATAQL